MHTIQEQNLCLYRIILGKKAKFVGNNGHISYFYNISNQEIKLTIQEQNLRIYL